MYMKRLKLILFFLLVAIGTRAYSQCPDLWISSTRLTQCGPTQFILTVRDDNGNAVGGTYQWYDGLTPIAGATQSSYTTSVVSASKMYRVEVHYGICDPYWLDVNVQPNATPSLPDVPATYVCGGPNGATIKVNHDPNNASDYWWYDENQNLIDPLVSGEFMVGGTANSQLTINLVTDDAAFYVRAVKGSCVSGLAVAQVGLIESVPTAPSATSQGICGPGVVSMTASSTESQAVFKWYTSSSSQTVWKTGTQVSSNSLSAGQTATYWVEVVNGYGCVSPRTSIVVTSHQIPATPPNTTLQICDFETLSLSYPEGTYRWYSGAGTYLATGNEYQHKPLPEGIHQFRAESVSSAGCISNGQADFTVEVSGSCDTKLNRIYTATLDENGNAVAEHKKYFDYSGTLVQSQSKNITRNQIMVSQSLSDAQNRTVINSLIAPLDRSAFQYRYRFIIDANGNLYDKASYDGPKKYTADPVGNSARGTLGWYYSANNDLEDHVPVTSFPYVRDEYYHDGTNELMYSAGAGETLRLGAGHELLNCTFPVIGELEEYRALRLAILPSVQQAADFQNKGTQTIVRDQNGRFSIVIADLDGNIIATARPGTVTNHTLEAENVMSFVVGDELKYFYLLENETITFGTPEGGRIPEFPSCKIENVITNQVVFDDEASGTLQLPKGFYRVITSGNLAPFTISYKNYYQDVSYQFFDDAGRLRVSVSPNGYNAWKVNNVPFTDIDKTTYTYNHRGWLLFMTEPDAGTTTYKYRRDGKIRFSQNSLQAGPSAHIGKFSYTNYDALGRPVESGEYTGSTYAFDNNLNTQLEFAAQINFPSADVKDWVRTHYDEPASDFTTVTGLTVADYPQEFIRGAVSWTENENIRTYYSYDELGRVTWMAQKPAGIARTFVLKYEYDFLGNVEKVASLAYEQGQVVEQFYHHYEYDADKRLSNAYTSTDGVNKKLRAHYVYYLHGPLKRLELGGGVQGIDFVYNIRGWLTQINHPNTLFDPNQDGSGDSDFRKDAFGMIFEYYDEHPDPVSMVPSDEYDPLRIHHLPDAERQAVPSLAFGSNHQQLKDQLAQARALAKEMAGKRHDVIVPMASALPIVYTPDAEEVRDAIEPFVAPTEEPLINFMASPSLLTASTSSLPLPEVYTEGLVPDAIEFAALKDLYDSLAGSGWTNKTGWPAAGSWPASATSTEMDAWFGIVVTGGDITEINMSNNNLTGKIPASIGNLTKLKNLFLLTNKLSGRIPSSIGNLTALENLSLYNNMLTGSIPSTIGNMTALKQLMLFNNQLSGSIPSEIGNLTNLWILRLYTNQLSGALPSSIGSLSALGYLEISQNQFTGALPASMSNLTNLLKIEIGNNQFTGSLPDVSGWTKITSIDIGYTQLSGSLPAALGTLTTLTNLRIYNANFTGDIPNLGNLTNLQFLYLYGLTSLTPGPVPDWIGNLNKVTHLLMSFSNRTGELPESLRKLTKLTTIQFTGNQLTGEIPAWLGEFSDLTTIYIHQNQFTGQIPPSLGNLNKLTRLYLQVNKLTGPIPAEIGNLSQLAELYLWDNQLSGEMPASIGNLTNLVTTFFYNNKLTGVFPDVSNLTKLEKIDGTNNQFTGISSSVLNLPKLIQLKFNYNKLTSIPNIAQAVNKANLTAELMYNYLDFTDLEPLFATVPHGIYSLKYGGQYVTNFNGGTTVPVPQGSTLILQAPPKGTYTTVTWERQTGPTTWTNVNSLNEDATGQTFKLSNVTSAINGYVYRVKMSNTRVTGVQLTSDPLTVQVTESYVANDADPANKLYNGLITAMRWRTDKPHGLEGSDLNGMYRFQYDEKYQIKDANWATHNGVNYTLQGNQYRVTNLTYDPNGNIQTLNRYDQNGVRTNQFAYTYAANKNQLQSVTGYANAYTYNSLGQMISVDKTDKTNETAAAGNGDQTIEYDVTGKVTKVYGQSASQIGYYKMDGSGANSWGPMEAGTIYGPVVATDHTGKANSAYLFDGMDDSIIIPDVADKTSFKATDFTVAVRVKKLVSINGSAHEALIGKWNHASNPGTNEWLLAIGNNGNANTAAMSIETGTTRYQAVGTTVLQANTWYHVVGQREGDRLKIYVNGQLEGSVNIGIVSINNTASQLFVARMLGGFMTNCAIADIQIFNRALKDDEIKALNEDKASELLVSNLYDDRGFRLAKVNHTTSKTTWYIRDASGNVVNTSEQNGLPAFASTNVTWRTLIHTLNTNGTLSLVNNATDAMAVSEQRLSPGNDGELTYVISDLSNKKNIGLRDAGNANYKYFFDFYADLNTIAIRKHAQLQASFSYVVGDVIKIVRQGENLLFYHNSTLKFTLPVPSSVTLEAFVELGESTATVSGLALTQTSNKPVTTTEIPVYASGKLGIYYPQQDGSMAYEITDHLGNVRALVREQVNIYQATMEDNGQAEYTNPRVQEMNYFSNIFETEVDDYRMNHTAPMPGVEESPSRAAYLYWINGQTTNKSVGPALALKVSAKDTVKLETWVRYENKPTYARNLTLLALSQLLGNSFAYQPGFEANTPTQTTAVFNNVMGTPGLINDGTDVTRPFAYLNYILFDENMQWIDAGFKRVTTDAGFDAGQETHPDKKPVRLAFEAPLVIPQNGYIYVWVSNESEATKVWFDDLTIVHTQAVVTQATDFGVWGDVLRELKSDNITYRHGYQGQFAEKDAETGWNHFELREYDPVIGRWTVPDPDRQYWNPYSAMGSDPINFFDSDGGYSKFWAKWYNFWKGGNGAYFAGMDGNKEVWGFNTDLESGYGIQAHFGEDRGNNYQDGPLLTQWKPNLLQSWQMSESWSADFTYELVDDAYVTLHFFTPWKDVRHLDGRDVVGNEASTAFVNNVLNLVPAAKGLKLTAPQFSKLFKGTILARLKPNVRGKINKIMNKWIFGTPAKAAQKAASLPLIGSGTKEGEK
jgi:RHS repeat-associated protein